MPELNVKLRQQTEKAADTNQLKGIVYGKNLDTKSLWITRGEFLKLYRLVKRSSLFDLIIDGQAPVKALVQAIQLHPINMQPVHVDFRQIRMDQEFTVSVPLVYIGESLAIKSGGTLVKALDSLDVTCLPDKLPKQIEVDLGALKAYEDKITVGDLKLPEGVKVEQDASETIALAEAPMTEEQLKKLDESAVGDVTAVTSEAEEKRKEKEAADAAAAEGEKKA